MKEWVLRFSFSFILIQNKLQLQYLFFGPVGGIKYYPRAA